MKHEAKYELEENYQSDADCAEESGDDDKCVKTDGYYKHVETSTQLWNKVSVKLEQVEVKTVLFRVLNIVEFVVESRMRFMEFKLQALDNSEFESIGGLLTVDSLKKVLKVAN